jgi:hypothetical protein
LGLRALEKDYDKSEDDIKALQSVGQMIGEVLKQLTEEKCKRRFVVPSGQEPLKRLDLLIILLNLTIHYVHCADTQSLSKPQMGLAMLLGAEIRLTRRN